MMNSRDEHYAVRLKNLVEEGRVVVKLEKPSRYDSDKYFQGEDKIQVQSWLTKVRNILQTAFGIRKPSLYTF